MSANRLPGFLAAAVLATLLAACSGDSIETGGCETLFGAPNENTGLDGDACRPERVCEGIDSFRPPVYGEADIAALRARVLVDPPALLATNPYVDASLVPDTSGVCAVIPESGVENGYRLQTFPDTAAAAAGGAVVTHGSACGACSSLQDLAVYLETPDLGDPVRECALIELGDNPAATLACIIDLGFTETCAQIWAFNSGNTRNSCLVECLDALDDPNHLPDGSLNACLACDEEASGPVFKAVAGRTRRNSGIPSAICRPGDSVESVLHDQYP